MFLTTGEDLTAAILKITKGFDFLYMFNYTYFDLYNRQPMEESPSSAHARIPLPNSE
jgi:hypothetical protein